MIAFQVKDAARPAAGARVRPLLGAARTRLCRGGGCDDKGGVYVSADQGDGNPSFIRKFGPALEPDKSFGYGGILASKQVRVLGIAAHGDHVVAAVNWARFLVLDTSGKFLGHDRPRCRRTRAP